MKWRQKWKKKVIKTKEIGGNQHRKWETNGSWTSCKQLRKGCAELGIEFDVITVIVTTLKLLWSYQFKWMSYKFSSHINVDVFEVSYI